MKKFLSTAVALMMALPSFAAGISVDGTLIDGDFPIFEDRIYADEETAREIFGEDALLTQIEGETYGAVRANCENSGFDVEWNDETKTAEITTKKADEEAAGEEDEFDGRYFSLTIQGKNMGIEDNSLENSAKLVANDGEDVWSLTAKGDGGYTFINKNSGKAIDMPASTTEAGRAATQYTSNSGANQTLVIEEKEEGMYALCFKHSSLYLTLGEDGVLTQEEYIGGENQLFAFEYKGDSEMRSLKTSEGYLSLDEETRERFDAYVYTTQAYTPNIYTQTAALLESEGYGDKTAREQAEILKKCLDFTAFNLVYIGEVPKDDDISVEVSNKTYIESYDVWRGTMEPVWCYDVTMSDGYTMNIYTTVEDCSVVDDAANALSRFPLAIRKYLKNIIHRMDTANNYNGGGNTIWIRLDYIPSENAIAQTLAHELGHVLDSNLTTDDSVWEQAIEADMVPVSGYGNSNRTEDLAEYSRLFHMARRSDEIMAAVEKVYPNRTKAYKALLYAADNEYYADYKEEYEELSPYEDKVEAYSTLSPAGSSLVLTVEDASEETGAKLVLAENENLPSQLWWVRHKKDGSVVMFNKATAYCVNVPGNSTDDNVQLITWNGGGSDNETWIVDEIEDAGFTFKAKHSSLYLGADGEAAVQTSVETLWNVTAVDD